MASRLSIPSFTLDVTPSITGKGFTHSIVHFWAEKQSLQWVPTFRPANLSALQNLAPFILVTAPAADCPFPQADLVRVMSGGRSAYFKCGSGALEAVEAREAAGRGRAEG